MIRNVHLLFDETLTRRSRSNPRIISEGIFERDSQRILIEHTRSLEKWYDLLSPIESIFVSSNENETIEKEKREEEKKTTAKEEKKKKKIVLQSNRCMHIAWFKFSSSLPSLFFFLLRMNIISFDTMIFLPLASK